MKIDLDFEQRLRILIINNPTSIYIYIYIYIHFILNKCLKRERDINEDIKRKEGADNWRLEKSVWSIEIHDCRIFSGGGGGVGGTALIKPTKKC